MKTSILSGAALAIISVSSVAFAVPQTQLTREQVVAELKALQSVGYQAGSDHTRYPQSLLAAQAELAKREATGSVMAKAQNATGVATGDVTGNIIAGSQTADTMTVATSHTAQVSYEGIPLHARTYRGQ